MAKFILKKAFSIKKHMSTKTVYLQLTRTNMASAEYIKMVADTLMPGFAPKDKSEEEFFFHFTLPPNSSYKVFYKKTDKSAYEFVRFEEDSDGR